VDRRRGHGSAPAGSDMLPAMRALFWIGAVVLGVSLGVGCLGGNVDDDCDEGCADNTFCSVDADRDPDGGCQFSASCKAPPADCAEEPTCECLIEQALEPYRKQGWSDDEVAVECRFEPMRGFTVASSLSAGCLPE
jgi:hypothetical protein